MSDFLKKLGTGVYAGIDEFLLGIPDFLLSKINNDAYKKFKDYRKNEGRTAETIGDIGSILGDLVLAPMAAGKLGAKFAAKGLKGGSKLAKGLKAVKNVNTLGDNLKGASKLFVKGGVGAGMSLADNLLRTTFAADQDEKEALKNSRNTAMLLGGLGGMAAPVVGQFREWSKGKPAEIKNFARLKRANAAADYSDGFAQSQSLKKYYKNASHEFKAKDTDNFRLHKLDLQDWAKRNNLEDLPFDELLEKHKIEIGDLLDKQYRQAWENPKVKENFSKALDDELGFLSKIKKVKVGDNDFYYDFRDLPDEDLASIFGTLDDAKQKKVVRLLNESFDRIDKSDSPLEVLNKIKNESVNWLGAENRNQAHLIRNHYNDILENVADKYDDKLKDLNRQYRYDMTYRDAKNRDYERELRNTDTIGHRFYDAVAGAEGAKSIADSLVGQAAANVAVGAPLGFMASGEEASLGEKLGNSLLYSGLLAGARHLRGNVPSAVQKKLFKAIEENASDVSRILNNPKIQRNVLPMLEKTTQKIGKYANIIGKDADLNKRKSAEEFSERIEEGRKTISDQMAESYRQKIEFFNKLNPDMKIENSDAYVRQYRKNIENVLETNPEMIFGKSAMTDVLSLEKTMLSHDVPLSDKLDVLKKFGLSARRSEALLEGLKGKSDQEIKKRLKPIVAEYIKNNLSPDNQSLLMG